MIIILVKLHHLLPIIYPWQGIPIIYYGTEQGFSGGRDPEDRESLWPNYNTSSDLYVFISTVVNFRVQQGSSLYDAEQIERYVDDQFFAFTRGEVRIEPWASFKINSRKYPRKYVL